MQQVFGYCRCLVPCAQRWLLVGEPEGRRLLREATAFAEYDDPWRKHGVMGTDDEEIMDKLFPQLHVPSQGRTLTYLLTYLHGQAGGRDGDPGGVGAAEVGGQAEQ